MLTKKDIEQLNGVIQNAVKAGFDDFYQNIFLPHVERSEAHMERTEEQFGVIKADLEEIKEHVKDHDKRIRKLESITSN